MKIAVVGLGLIGGSIAKAIKKKTTHTVMGYDRCAETMKQALESGTIDEGAEDDFSAADMVLVALYPAETVTFLQQHAGNLSPGCLVIDLCGVKRVVCEAAAELFRDVDALFLGGHPMAGREVSGFAHADAELFANASMILTPDGSFPANKLKEAEAFFLSLGFGRITLTTPEHHDEVIAYTSQLAHIVSSAYIQSPTAREYMGFSAGSFRDLTRVAWLNEYMWAELFLENSDYLVRQIGVIIDNLTRFRQLIGDGDTEALRRMLREGREIKENLS